MDITTGYGAVSLLRKLMMTIVVILGLGLGGARAESTVVIFGDSLVQGYGLPAERGLVPHLESWLRENGTDVTLVNAGVSGDTTQGGAARIAWTLSEEIDAIVIALGGNDMLRGIDPTVVRQNMEIIVQEAASSGVAVLVVGIEAPLNYGPDYKAAFDPIFADIAERFEADYHPGFFSAFEEDVLPFMQPDAIHPNAEGVAQIVEAVGPFVAALTDGS